MPAVKKAEKSELPTYEEKHLDLIADGFTIRTVSESGSRYYSKPGEPGFRVSDHNPNAATQKWMWRRWVTDIRVQSSGVHQKSDDSAEFESDYHDRTEISRGMLAVFNESPREYEAMYVTGTLQPKQETPEMAIGSFTHQQLLEPDLPSRVKIIPRSVLAKNGARTTNAYRDWCGENEGFIFLKQDEYDIAMRAADAIRKEIGPFIDNPKAVREHEIYWTDEPTGLKLRCKLDLMVSTKIGTYIIDAKTCADLKRFNHQISDGLWLQHCHYRTGAASICDDPQFFFCIVQKGGVFKVRNRQIDDESSDRCDAKYRELLDDLARRYESGDWSESGEGEIEKVSVYFGRYNQ